MLKTGPWNLTDLASIPKNGKTVFSIFHCGGGSTMGYKLSGFNVLGGVEIDPEMMSVYRANHNPKHSFLMGVAEFNKLPREKIPEELFNLDILDGSPPCSSFSMAGSREKKWGVKKKFREGQSEQVLDDLFFHFIETARRLQPKVVVAENVKGLIIGKAKGYVKQIFQMFNLAGYDTQLFLLNAAFMGVPQRRERTFFIARRKDLNLQKIEMKFNENLVSVLESFNGLELDGLQITEQQRHWWHKTKPGESFSKNHPKSHWFQSIKLNKDSPAPTLSASDGAPGFYLWDKPKKISSKMLIRIQSYPDDFNFIDQKVQYVCGMSVPPYMMNRVSDQIYKQWLGKL
jgi:DNA (cytosine-5)-methyltransferase 1